MNFRIAKAMKMDMGFVIHVGAHKFEEAGEYLDFGTKSVFWIDPIVQVNPESLPAGQIFLQTAVGDVAEKGSREFRIFSATGFSSFLQLEKPGSIWRGTPKLLETLNVDIDSLRNVQEKYHLQNFGTLVIDTQGSEFEILKSADLSVIDDLIIETSRVPLYSGETTHKDINKFLVMNGFHHNFNDSDLIFGHGDQYYSRTRQRQSALQFYRRLLLTLFVFQSFFNRIKVGMSMKLSMKRTN